MRRFSFVADIEFTLPPVQKLKCAQWVGYFVAKIIGPAAIGVNVIKMLVKGFGKEPGHDAEVFVVMRGEPMRVLLRDRGRAPRGRRVAHDFEFAGSEH